MSDLPLVSFKIYVKDLSIDEIIGFRAYTEDEQRKVAEMLHNAQDKAKFYKAVKYSQPILFKLNGVNIDVFNDVAKLRVPCGYTIIVKNINDEILNYIELNREETIYVKAKPIVKHGYKGRKYIEAEELEFIIATVDTDTAKELLNEYKAYELLAYGFGYKPCNESYGLLIPRLLPIFKPQNIPLHVISYTPPNTGKSTFASLLERVWSAYYYTETPSLPQLVGDGRFNSYGVAYHYRTIVFDEFDKIGSLERQRLEELWRVLQTGMEQGIWKRGVSSKADISYKNFVSLLFFGNVTDEDILNYTSQSTSVNHKDKLEYLIREKYRLSSKQFIDRIVYAEYLIKAPSTDEILNVQDGEVVYLDPKVTRGVLKIIDEKCFDDFKKAESDKAGRKTRQLNAFYTVLYHLGLEIELDTLHELYNGNITFLELYNEGEGYDTANESEAGETADVSDIEYMEWDMREVI